MKPNFTTAGILFSVLVLHSFAFSYQHACNLQDQSSLLSFLADTSSSTSSPPSLNWSSSLSCCQWEGVECNIKGKVTHLQLSSRGLEGLIPSSLNNLSKLTHLDLSGNYLTGTLGEGMVRLTHLRVLDLSSNSFFGSIPRGIGNLLYLEKLHLHTNNFSGLIPSSLANCTNLMEIILRSNHLNGDISKLDFSKFVQLQKLDLRNNSLSGTLPESIYSCKSLVAIGVALNNITGQISSKIVGLKSLSYISLTRNYFTNITTTLRVLAKCRNLKTLLLSLNFYGETLPIHTNFVGSDDFPKLEMFDLNNCNFGGPIPDWISNLKRLRHLSLVGNNMTGTIPDWVGTLPNLISLKLSDNNFSGHFPLNLCQLPRLVSPTVDTNFNYFHFDLSTSILLPNRTLSADSIYGGLDLSNNAFSGNIPSEIGNLRNLQQIGLNNNHFFGHIPMNISNLQKLELLDLSTNDLIGEIPISLERLSFLSYFDVSHNNLQGPIPAGGQFHTFPESSFEGNPDLCGEPLNLPCFTATRPGGKKRGHSSRHAILDGLFVGFASGFSAVLAVVTPYFWLKYYNRCGPSSRSRS